MKHTPEPWMMTEDDDTDVCIFGSDKKWLGNIGLDIPCDIADQNLSIVFDLNKANARRIVACVNACEGVPRETLDKIARKEMDGSEIFEAGRVSKERDIYRDLCVELNGVLLATKSFMQAGVEPSLKDIKNAINKAEQLLGEKK